MIPKKLHFTWKDHKLPARYEEVVHRWREKHPDWEIMIWSDEDNRALIAAHYPWFLEIYDAYPKPIMRCDAARYFILHYEGGVYSDLDVECYRSIDYLISGSRLFLTAEPERHLKQRQSASRGLPYLLCNALMGSEAGSEFWLHVHGVLEKQGACSSVMDATGPFMLTGAVMSADEALRPDVVLADVWSPLDGLGRECHDAEEYRLFMAEQFNCLNPPEKPLLSHLWHNSWSKKKLDKRPQGVGRIKWGWRQWRYSHLQYGVNEVELKIEKQKLEPVANRPRILIATPMKNAELNIERYRQLIESLDYPVEQIDIAILFSDSRDKTEERLKQLKRDWQACYCSVTVEQLDFNFHPAVKRWDRSIQLKRRSILAKCRNHLARKAFDGYAYCLFIDVDLSDIPTDLIQTMISAQHDVVMANCVKEDGRPFDLNAFLYEKLPNFKYLYRYARKQGLLQPPSGPPRVYLADLTYLSVVPLDCVGATALLVKSEVLKQGVHFPEEPYHFHIETEGFSLMAKERGFTVVGMPNLTVVHPSN